MCKCANCGREELGAWCNRQYQLYQQFTAIDDLRVWGPKIAAALLAIGSMEGFDSPS